jgi:diaminopimelate epimerase
MNLIFSKYEGAGNDFIVIHADSTKPITLSSEKISFLCNRRLGIGADGFIEIHSTENADFEMKYYNADGNLGSLCVGKNSIFKAYDGLHSGEIINEKSIKISILDVKNIEVDEDAFFLNTGSPHYVKYVTNLSDYPVIEEGKKIRHDKKFSPAGTNVNFAEVKDGNLFIRTFERGVEDETLACGTGITAVALTAIFKKHFEQGAPVTVRSKGGNLKVTATMNSDNSFSSIFLEGPANFVFSGHIDI